VSAGKARSGTPILSIHISSELEVVNARRRARKVAELAGLDAQDQARLAAAVSEIARNAWVYASGGKLELLAEPGALIAKISDRGPGILNLRQVLDGVPGASGSAGMGIIAARRMVDGFEIESKPGEGVTVWLTKRIPRNAGRLTAARLSQIGEALARQKPQDLLEELQFQSQASLRSLEEASRKRQEAERLSRELEETNRGVMALYAELEQQAERLREANRLQTRFYSYLSHEFRTPIHATLALTRILLSRPDRAWSPDEEKEIRFIQSTAENMLELVNDLLDTAKIAAGQFEVRPSRFEVEALFGALRGTMRHLKSDAVSLVFEEPAGIPPLYTDEGKVTQILRNLIANALKFTLKGQVTVSAAMRGDTVVFSVRDTGPGVAPEHQEAIFQDFMQVRSEGLPRVEGAGLGLPLCRRLAELLGGVVGVQSELGKGALFSLAIPRVFFEERSEERKDGKRNNARILLIDDDPVWHHLVSKMLEGSGSTLEHAMSGEEGLRAIEAAPPALVLLDLVMPELNGFEVLGKIPPPLPVVVVTSKVLTQQERETLGLRAVRIVSKAVTTAPSGYDTLASIIAEALCSRI
jgi:signal transduction histidine kinase